MVEVDDERLNVFARGARCVSLSSTHCVRIVTVQAGGIRTLSELPRHGCGRSDSRGMQEGRPLRDVEMREGGVSGALERGGGVPAT